MKKGAGHSVARTVVEDVPWKDIFFGLFIPLNIFYALTFQEKPLVGTFLPVFCCVLYIAIAYMKDKVISWLSIMTALMILLSFSASFLKGHPLLHLIVESFDNVVIGLIFLGSLLLHRPFILLFLAEETLQRMPEKLRKSSNFMRAWRILTAVWGVAMIIGGGFMVYMNAVGSLHTPLVDYFLGWPLVVALLAISVNFPHYYWKMRSPGMAEEETEEERTGEYGAERCADD